MEEERTRGEGKIERRGENRKSKGENMRGGKSGKMKRMIQSLSLFSFIPVNKDHLVLLWYTNYAKLRFKFSCLPTFFSSFTFLNLSLHFSSHHVPSKLLQLLTHVSPCLKPLSFFFSSSLLLFFSSSLFRKTYSALSLFFQYSSIHNEQKASVSY